jgi:hypothetical protein
MTISELAMAKGKPIDRDIAFDLLLDRVNKGFGDIPSYASLFMFFVVVVQQFEHQALWLPALLPATAVPATKIAALVGIVAWLAYGLFGLRRRNRIERTLVQAEINALRLQQLAAQS